MRGTCTCLAIFLRSSPRYSPYLYRLPLNYSDAAFPERNGQVLWVTHVFLERTRDASSYGDAMDFPAGQIGRPGYSATTVDTHAPLLGLFPGLILSCYGRLVHFSPIGRSALYFMVFTGPLLTRRPSDSGPHSAIGCTPPPNLLYIIYRAASLWPPWHRVLITSFLHMKLGYVSDIFLY